MKWTHPEFRIAILIAIFISCTPALVGCIPGSTAPAHPGPTVTYNPFASLSPTPLIPLAGDATSPPRATTTPEIPSPGGQATIGSRTKYVLQAEVNYHIHSLTVREAITYQNSTGIALEDLLLVVEPNRRTGCFTLDSLSGAKVAGFKLEGSRLYVNLDTLLAPGEVVELELN